MGRLVGKNYYPTPNPGYTSSTVGSSDTFVKARAGGAGGPAIAEYPFVNCLNREITGLIDVDIYEALVWSA